MTDAAIIDSYERAYNIAQAVDADHGEPDMPPMRDCFTMAWRVRGYVLGSKHRNSAGKRIPTGTMHKGRGTKACVLAVAAEYLVETGVPQLAE
jgi:repA